jgi:hypothetical protein
MKSRTLVSLLLLLAGSGCSSTGPLPTVTLLVTNTTCNTGPCTPLQILGFPSNNPSTPGGLWSIALGTVLGPSACFVLPPADTASVTDVGTGRTTYYVWTVESALELGSLSNPSGRFQAQPSTGPFVPVDSRGWSAEFPGGTAVSTTHACTP